MPDVTSSSSNNKNTIDDSTVKAGGNIQIGDNITNNYITETIGAPPANKQGKVVFGKRVILSIIILFVSFFGFYFWPSPDAPISSVSSPAKPATEVVVTKPPEKRKSHPAVPLPTMKSESSPVQPAQQTFDVKKFLRGDTEEITANAAMKIEAFEMSQHEVTVGQYYTFCKIKDHPFPHDHVDTLNLNEPMRFVTWAEANAYCRYVGGRLPTTAEWDWAAQKGIGSNTLSDEEKSSISWNAHNSAGRLHQVKGKGRLGNLRLYDMFGNVAEWCADGSQDGRKFIRGGHYNLPLGFLTNNYNRPATSRSEVVGFRVAFDM